MRPIDSKSYHILVVLAARPLHGYGIRQEVEERSQGAVRLWPATLYGTLADLAELGWIDATEGPGGTDDDPRRRYYTLTPEGRDALEAETERMESLARLARSRLREAT